MRRPTTMLAGALAAAAWLATGCSSGDGSSPAAGAQRTPPPVLAATEPSQVANGPLLAGDGPLPLKVDLENPKDHVRVRFKRPPRAGLLFDLDTGQVLWRHNPTRLLPIASVTKMMTALVVRDKIAEGSKVRITKEALAYRGSGVGVLPRNRWVGVSAMLHGLMLPSGNDAAIALAQRASGTVEDFVTDMNRRAAKMQLRCSHFSTPSGLRDKGNYSCTLDLAAIARAVLDDPALAKVVKRRSAVLPFPIKGGRLYLNSHNPLILERYPGALGIKTGFTDAAGMCLVGAAEQHGRRLGVIVLHSPNPGLQATQLLNRGFAAVGRK